MQRQENRQGFCCEGSATGAYGLLAKILPPLPNLLPHSQTVALAPHICTDPGSYPRPRCLYGSLRTRMRMRMQTNDEVDLHLHLQLPTRFYDLRDARSPRQTYTGICSTRARRPQRQSRRQHEPGPRSCEPRSTLRLRPYLPECHFERWRRMGRLERGVCTWWYERQHGSRCRRIRW
jgi:hypothetical protein